ncbi:MAG: hypothetical protein ACI3W8_05920 [Oscillospiraceae bacterium]
MNLSSFTVWTLLFFAYSFLGWVGEMIYCSAGQRRLCEKRGFLNGCICPIYGFGALLVLLALRFVGDSVVLTFFGGLVLTSALEYFTSWLMEKAFHMRWWDYSHYRFQLHGRICLVNSTLFGLASVLLRHVIHPPLLRAAEALVGSGAGEPLAFFLLGIFVCDTALSIRSAVQLDNRLNKLQEAKEQIRDLLDEQKEKARLWREERQEQRDRAAEELYQREMRLFEQRQAALQQYMDSLHEGQDLFERRLLLSHPHLRTYQRSDSLELLRDALKRRIEQGRKKNHKTDKADKAE